MAQYKDLLPSSQQGWLHELARAEVHPDAEKLLQLGRSFDPQQVVEESTVEFLSALREQFSNHTKLFNSYAEAGVKFQEVKLYSIANTAADFMIFRNQIKLVVSNNAHGVITLSFAQHLRGTMAINGQIQGAPAASPVNGQQQELLAQIGPFRDVNWTFQAERVTPEQIAKFYFAEFVRATRENKKSRAGNQLLLDQIKALLQEKGLDL